MLSPNSAQRLDACHRDLSSSAVSKRFASFCYSKTVGEGNAHAVQRNFAACSRAAMSRSCVECVGMQNGPEPCIWQRFRCVTSDPRLFSRNVGEDSQQQCCH